MGEEEMNKESIKIAIVSVILAFGLTFFSGCSADYVGSNTADSNKSITRDFTKIEDNLYYCNDTKIVYWIGGLYTANIIGDDYTTSYMTPYYAPNGYPYIYKNNKLVEINEGSDK